MSRYVVMAESGADIPAPLVKRYGIEVIPMHVALGDKSLDDGTFDPAHVFEYQRKTGIFPKTSACTPYDFERFFERLERDHPNAHIFYLAYSAATTNTYANGVDTARRRGMRNVSCFDTKSCSIGQGLIVLETARFIEGNPDASVADVEAHIKDLIARICFLFVPGDLAYLKAGGRLSNVAYVGAQLLKIHPAIDVVDGTLVAIKKFRGSRLAAARKMLEFFAARDELDLSRIGLVRSSGLEEPVSKYLESHTRQLGFKEVFWSTTGCVISCHCGPGSFGIAAFAKA